MCQDLDGAHSVMNLMERWTYLPPSDETKAVGDGLVRLADVSHVLRAVWIGGSPGAHICRSLIVLCRTLRIYIQLAIANSDSSIR